MNTFTIPVLAPELSSNHPHPHPYVIQAYCTGIGWADSKYGGPTLGEAEQQALTLINDPSHWTHPHAPKQVRIVTAKDAVHLSRPSIRSQEEVTLTPTEYEEFGEALESTGLVINP